MSVPFSVATIYYAEYGFGTWQITAITATEVKYIASSQQTPSFLGREFSMNKHDFQARLDSGVYKKVGRSGRRPPDHMKPIGVHGFSTCM